MKICVRCKKELPLSDFSIQKHYLGKKVSSSYLHGKCKQCISNQYQEWYKLNGRKRRIDYGDIIIEWRLHHPKEVKAHHILAEAIRKNYIKKSIFCTKCGKKKKVYGHHDDYSKPLEVLWLCGSCHKFHHLNKKT